MFFRQVLHDDLGCASYVVADAGEAAVIDPKWEVEDYLELAEEHGFAIRHVLESLMLLTHLPQNAALADIGSGGGLPIVPCLIARPDLNVTLIESSQKKVVFLREISNRLDLRTTIIARPFEDVPALPVSFITCRALDQFMRKLPALINWAPQKSTLLLFGGETLGDQLRRANVNFEQLLIPQSEQRYLFLATD